jgi:saccharopine dehydrogenase-like NADP-dependent oxidoreductase
MSAIAPIRAPAHDRIVVGLGAIGDVAGTKLAQLGDERVEVAQRLAQQDERGEQHGPLPAEVGPAKSGLTAGAALNSRA